jgi:AmiR/NasT family two-component response regulator
VTGKPISRPLLAGWHAVVLHRPHPGTENVVRQLERLGLSVKVAWPDLEPADAEADVVFFDADMGCDEQFPWAPGKAPMPLVALIGSEAPGRIEWALSQGANAHLLKPVTSAGVYSVLLIAAHAFESRRRLHAQVAELTERVRKRPVVARALLSLMQDGLDEGAAMQRLRTMAMDQRVTIEDLAETMVAGALHPQGGLRRRAE